MENMNRHDPFGEDEFLGEVAAFEKKKPGRKKHRPSEEDLQKIARRTLLSAQSIRGAGYLRPALRERKGGRALLHPQGTGPRSPLVDRMHAAEAQAR